MRSTAHLLLLLAAANALPFKTTSAASEVPYYEGLAPNNTYLCATVTTAPTYDKNYTMSFEEGLVQGASLETVCPNITTTTTVTTAPTYDMNETMSFEEGLVQGSSLQTVCPNSTTTATFTSPPTSPTPASTSPTSKAFVASTTKQSSAPPAISSAPFRPTTAKTTLGITTTKAASPPAVPVPSPGGASTTTVTDVPGAVGAVVDNGQRANGGEDEGSDNMVFVGVGVGIFVLLVVAAIVAMVVVRRRRKQKKTDAKKGGPASKTVAKTPAAGGTGPGVKNDVEKGQPLPKVPAKGKKGSKKPLEPKNMDYGKIDKEHFKFRGPLLIEAGGQQGPLRHATEGQKSHSIRGPIVFNDDMNEVYDIGSAVEILEEDPNDNETLIVDDDQTLIGDNSSVIERGAKSKLQQQPPPK